MIINDFLLFINQIYFGRCQSKMDTLHQIHIKVTKTFEYAKGFRFALITMYAKGKYAISLRKNIN